MRRQRLLAALLLAILIAPSIVTPIRAQAQQGYEEKLQITVAGTTAFWKVTLSGLNVSSLGISDIEKVAGVQDFDLLFSKYSSLDPRVEFFTSHGYDAIGMNFIPQKGAVLRVKAPSLDSARQLANALEAPLRLGFAYLKSEGDNHFFYSHAELGRPDESRFLPIKIWSLIQNRKGFDLLVSIDKFLSNPLPVLALGGKKAGASFVYSVAVGGITLDAIKDKSLKFSNLFPEARGINASASATSSILELRMFGGFIPPRDKYPVDYNPELRSTTIRSVLTPKENRSGFGFTMVQSPPILVVTREVDKSAVAAGETLEYRIRFENVAPAGTIAIDRVSAKETWWQQHFEATRAEPDQNITKLEPGQSKTLVYVLRAKTSSPTIAETTDAENTFTYSYKISDKSFTSAARANDLKIVLNRVASSLIAVASATNYLPDVSGNASAVLAIRNGGARSAFGVKVFLGDKLIETIPSIAPDPLRPIKVTAPLIFDSFTLRKRDLSWRVEWTDDQPQSIRSNTFAIFENYTRPDIPALLIGKASVENKTKGEGIFETTITIRNDGTRPVTALEVIDSAPKGTTFSSSSNFAPSPRGLSSSIESIAPAQTKTVNYLSKGTSKMNLIAGPALVSFKVGDLAVERLSPSVVTPNAITVVKTLNRQAAPIGYNFTVALKLENKGSETIFDVGLEGGDRPLRVAKGRNTDSRSVLAPGESISLNYEIQTFRPENASLLGALATFTLAGSIQGIRSEAIPLQIFNTPEIQIRFASSTILDNTPYEIIIDISNPAPFALSGLTINGGEPQNIVLRGALEAPKQLAPNGKTTIRITATSPEPNKQMKFQPKITHVFDGQPVTVVSPEVTIAVNENVAARFGLPVGIGIAIVLVTWILVRRAVQTKAEEA